MPLTPVERARPVHACDACGSACADLLAAYVTCTVVHRIMVGAVLSVCPLDVVSFVRTILCRIEHSRFSAQHRPVYGDLQITFLDVLQLTRHHKNIIDNECSAISSLRQATREL